MLLKNGFGTYQDNTALYASRKVKQISAPEKIENAVPVVEEPTMTLKEAFDFGLNLKKKLINSTTKKIKKNRIKNFLKWMGEHHPELKTINYCNVLLNSLQLINNLKQLLQHLLHIKIFKKNLFY